MRCGEFFAATPFPMAGMILSHDSVASLPANNEGRAATRVSKVLNRYINLTI